MAAFEKSRVRGSGFGPWRATPPVRISFRGCAGCGRARAPAASHCVSHGPARFPRRAARAARRRGGRTHPQIVRRLLRLTGAAAAIDCGSWRGTRGHRSPRSSESSRARASRSCARPRDSSACSIRCPTVCGCARKRAAQQDVVLFFATRSGRARTSLRRARARDRARGRTVDRVAEADVVRRDRPAREHRARGRSRARSRRQQGVRGRRHVVGACGSCTGSATVRRSAQRARRQTRALSARQLARDSGIDASYSPSANRTRRVGRELAQEPERGAVVGEHGRR